MSFSQGGLVLVELLSRQRNSRLQGRGIGIEIAQMLSIGGIPHADFTSPVTCDNFGAVMGKSCFHHNICKS